MVHIYRRVGRGGTWVNATLGDEIEKNYPLNARLTCNVIRHLNGK